jgi:DegV family protein with EDD domain
LQFSGKVRVIDSGQLSLALGFQVLAAAAAIAQGLHLDAVLESLQDVRRRVRLLAMLDTLEYIRRSGRVSWARARLGSLLDIKPIIRVQEGEVQSVGNTRTRQKGIERLLELFTSQGAFEKLAVLHSNAETDARLLLSRLELHPAITPLVVNVTPIIGTHVGPNGLGFACVLKAQG